MRRTMTCGFVSAVACLWVASVESAVLVKDGASGYSIVLDESAGATDQLAARELSQHIKRSTGVEIPVVSGVRKGKTVELGTPEAKAAVTAALGREPEEEESGYVVKGDKVFIGGGGQTGNAYGVYLFLEKELGCRWYMRTGEDVVPARKILEVKDCAVFEKPAIGYRMMLAANNGRTGLKGSGDLLFYFRNRINQIGGNYSNARDPFLKKAMVPRIRELWPQCHSFFIYLPKKKYFKKHPEWFSLLGGKRIDRHLCFSNPEMRAELTKNLLAHAESRGGKGFLDLSQDDAGGDMCQCEGCKAAKKKYGTPAGKFFEFLHELGPVVKKRFPELIIHTLAYHRDCTQIPPVGMKPFPDNIAIVFAPIDDDQFKSVAHPNNALTLQDFLGWVKLAKVWLWDYPTLYHQPFGHLGRMADSIRKYHAEGLTGTYIEHDWHVDFGGGFADMQTWLFMRTFRDPSLDWRALRDEFCAAVYGAAADDMIAYNEELERQREAFKGVVSPFGRADCTYTPADVVRWQKAFDGMERKVAGDEATVHRLREVRLLLDMQALVKWQDIKKLGADVGFSPADVYSRATNTFEKAVQIRYPENPEYAKRVRSCVFRKQFDSRLAAAMADIRPLPEKFRSLPEDKVMQIFAFGTTKGHTVKVPMEDAALGYAHKEIFGPDKKNIKRFPFSVGMYDKTYNTYQSKKLWIGPDNAVFGKFHPYHVGKCRFVSPATQVWIGNSWWLNQKCGECFHPGVDEEWDLYVSLKIEGPEYDPCSKLKESGVYFDRLIFVGPYPVKKQQAVSDTK